MTTPITHGLICFFKKQGFRIKRNQNVTMMIKTNLRIGFLLKIIRPPYVLMVFFAALGALFVFPCRQGRGDELWLTEKPLPQFALPNCAVAHMIQDSTGYLWIATACGLYKYDGYSYREYRHVQENPTSLSHNRIRCLLQDHAGVIWVGTQGGGLNRYHPEQDAFELIPLQSAADGRSVSGGQVTSLLEDRSGRIWIGSFEGLRVLNPDRSAFEGHFMEPERAGSLENEWINALCEDAAGYIWIGTRWKGLQRYDPVSRRLESIENRFVDGDPKETLGSIATLFEDSSRSLWIGTRSRGLYRLDPGRGEPAPIFFSAGLRHKKVDVRSLGEDAAKKLWVGTSEGLFVLDPGIGGSVTRPGALTENSSVVAQNIRSIALDRFGQLWIGFFEGGITRINLEKRRQFNYYDVSTVAGRRDQNITSMCEDVLGRIWTTTHGRDDTVWILNPRTREHHRRSFKTWVPDRAGDVQAMAADRDGFLWALSEKNVMLRIDPFQDRVIQSRSLGDVMPGYGNLSIRNPALVVDAKDRFWIRDMEQLLGPISAGLEGVQALVHRAGRKKGFQSGNLAVFDSWVILVYQGPTTGIWIVTGEGAVYRYNETSDEIDLYGLDASSRDYLADVTLFDIYEDRDGRVWFATDKGLMKVDAGGNRIVKSYTQQNGLSSEVIKGIIQDDAGYFWLGTLNGLIKFDEDNETFFDFGVLDVIFQSPVMRVSSGRALKSRGGRIYMTGRSGFMAFDPGTIRTQAVPPEVVINTVKIYERNVIRASSNPAMILTKQEWRDQTLKIPFRQNALQIEYSGLHFAAPELNQYAVMLEGLGTDWHYVQSKRSATYANLTPGSYVFRVKAANSHGVWNETGASLAFVVLKPYWRTWWFMLSGGSAFILFLVVVFKVQAYRSEKQKRLLESKVAERTRALEESQRELKKQERLETLARTRRLQEDLTHVSEHERQRVGQLFHEDLSPHLMGTETLMHVLVARLEKHLPEEVPHAKKIEDLIHGSIDKARNLAHGLAPRLMVEKNLRQVLTELAEVVSSTFGIVCELKMEGGDDVQDREAVIHIFYIVQEAVYNAIKHADANHIRIHLRVADPGLRELTVSDNGPGIRQENRHKGMGLRIMEIRAEALGASLDIHQRPQGGTRIRVAMTPEPGKAPQ